MGTLCGILPLGDIELSTSGGNEAKQKCRCEFMQVLESYYFLIFFAKRFVFAFIDDEISVDFFVPGFVTVPTVL